MSALQLDDRKDLADVLYYAPPQARVPAEDSTIRPVLERLSRGESQGDSSVISEQPIPQATPTDISTAPRIPLTMAVRLAIATGLIAALAIPAVAFLKPHTERPAPAALTEIPKTAIQKTEIQTTEVQKTEMPRKVHTISFQPEKPTAVKALSDSAAKRFLPPSAPQETGSSDGGEAGVTASVHPSGDALALAAPLKLWAMFPDSSMATTSNVVAQPQIEKPTHEPLPKHAAHVRHYRVRVSRHGRHHARHYARRHHARRHVAAAPAPAQQAAQPAESQTAAAMPSKPNPIQAAINSLLGKK